MSNNARRCARPDANAVELLARQAAGETSTSGDVPCQSDPAFELLVGIARTLADASGYTSVADTSAGAEPPRRSKVVRSRVVEPGPTDLVRSPAAGRSA